MASDRPHSSSTPATALAAVLRPVRMGNALEETTERLLHAIRLGVAGPGDRLPAERELATRLRISRVTLRDAIKVLHEAGYLESRRGRYGGTFVKQGLPTPDGPAAPESGQDLEDVLTVRYVLEAGVAEIAASRVLSEEDRLLLHEKLVDAASSGLAEYRRKDSRLHLAIAEAAASASLTRAVADVRIRVNDLLDPIPLRADGVALSNRQHETVVAAILSGDAGAARAAMAEHLDATAALLRDHRDQPIGLAESESAVRCARSRWSADPSAGATRLAVRRYHRGRPDRRGAGTAVCRRDRLSGPPRRRTGDRPQHPRQLCA